MRITAVCKTLRVKVNTQTNEVTTVLTNNKKESSITSVSIGSSSPKKQKRTSPVVALSKW